MPIFKDTVALEECPAKTAESVSYAATFVVLGWLLVGNYSGFGHAELDSSAIVNTDPPRADTLPPAVFTDTKVLNETQNTAVTLHQLDTEAKSSNFASTAPVWHTQIEQFESHPHLRTFSTAIWREQTSDAGQESIGFIEGLDVHLPIIDADYLFPAQSSSDPAIIDALASNLPAQNELVREITVTGETRGFTSRPENIQRPQIPRPSRAQRIQRSFILPPRIQALRP